MRAKEKLLTMQRRFLGALFEPIFEESRKRTSLSDRAGQVSSDFIQTAEDYIAPSKLLKPQERLELYHRQYWYRLLDSIEEDFPGLKKLCGDEEFWNLIEAYLEEEPPSHYTLRYLGQGLASFIEQNPSLVTHPVHATEMARLEYALCLCFEAGEKVALDPSLLASSRIRLQPHISLMAFQTPVDLIWKKREDDEKRGEISSPSQEPDRFLVIFRDRFEPSVEAVSPTAYEILRGIDETHSLSLGMERIEKQDAGIANLGEEEISEWFRVWMSRGWICSADDGPGEDFKADPGVSS